MVHPVLLPHEEGFETASDFLVPHLLDLDSGLFTVCLDQHLFEQITPSWSHGDMIYAIPGASGHGPRYMFSELAL